MSETYTLHRCRTCGALWRAFDDAVERLGRALSLPATVDAAANRIERGEHVPTTSSDTSSGKAGT